MPIAESDRGKSRGSTHLEYAKAMSRLRHEMRTDPDLRAKASEAYRRDGSPGLMKLVESLGWTGTNVNQSVLDGFE